MSKKEQIAATAEYLMRYGAQYSTHRTDRLGTFGPASPVRQIDPKTGEVLAILQSNSWKQVRPSRT